MSYNQQWQNNLEYLCFFFSRQTFCWHFSAGMAAEHAIMSKLWLLRVKTMSGATIQAEHLNTLTHTYPEQYNSAHVYYLRVGWNSQRQEGSVPLCLSELTPACWSWAVTLLLVSIHGREMAPGVVSFIRLKIKWNSVLHSYCCGWNKRLRAD